MSCKKSKVSYKNKVAFVQSETIFEDDTRIKYLKIKKSQFLTLDPTNPDGDNEVQVFNFIKKHAKKNDIYKFVLHVDSGTLSKLIDYMDERKQSSRNDRKLLKKCTLVATYSNADYVRQKNIDKATQIYFSLSPLSILLSSIPNGSLKTSSDQPKEILVVVSDDTVNPYFQQIIDSFGFLENQTVDLLRIKDLTTQKLNTFSSGDGYLIITALSSEEEFNTFSSTVSGSDFKKGVTFIELSQPTKEGLDALQASVADINTVSSGVCVNATGYSDLNNFLPYEKCAAALTVTWESWEKFKETNVLSLNTSIVSGSGAV